MKKYIFPFNYDETNKILGFFDYQLIVPLTIYGLLLLLLLSLLSISIFIKLGIFIILFFPLAFLLNTSIYGEPFYIFVFFVIKHHFHSHIYLLDTSPSSNNTQSFL